MELILHQDAISGNCYKVRLVAALVGEKLQINDVDILAGETKTHEFKTKINANGEIPVLQIGTDKFLPQSNAAIYHIAASHNSALIPYDTWEHSQMLQWMFFEQNTLEPNLGVYRKLTFIDNESDLTEAQKAKIPMTLAAGEKALDLMNHHLAENKWFVADRLTLAEVALYPYTYLSQEAGFDMMRWPNVHAWCDRIAQQPGFIPYK